MCDTIVALPSSTAAGGVVFGKNSDRERNEAQAVDFVPADEHASGTVLNCTYIEIPQARRTHAALLCRPFWMWGAEMGANEHNVVIGNEAVHAPLPAASDPALLGMDLLRLGLERAASAAEAVEVIVTLLERHGQGGNCGHLLQRYYNNSFLIADPHEAFVLETVDRDWVVQRAAGVRSISNAYSIGAAFDRCSTGMRAMTGAAGAVSLVNPEQDALSHGRARCNRSGHLLRTVQGRVSPADVMAILRDHGSSTRFHPAEAPQRTICMHAAEAARGGQTVGSLVSDLTAGQALHWVTGTAAPCLSIFKPVLPGLPPPSHGPRPTDRCDDATLWWRHERWHRALLPAFPDRLATVAQERDALEAGFRDRMAAVMSGGTLQEKQCAVAACWNEADAAERRWAQWLGQPAQAPVSAAFADAWAEMNRRAALA
ncbi:MAG: hypothetical protein AB7O80_09075 [Acetobacteraceae bacterium]